MGEILLPFGNIRCHQFVNEQANEWSSWLFLCGHSMSTEIFLFFVIPSFFFPGYTWARSNCASVQSASLQSVGRSVLTFQLHINDSFPSEFWRHPRPLPAVRFRVYFFLSYYTNSHTPLVISLGKSTLLEMWLGPLKATGSGWMTRHTNTNAEN